MSCPFPYDRLRREVGSGGVSRGEKMLYSGTNPEAYITEYTLVYEDNTSFLPAVRRTDSPDWSAYLGLRASFFLSRILSRPPASGLTGPPRDAYTRLGTDGAVILARDPLIQTEGFLE